MLRARSPRRVAAYGLRCAAATTVRCAFAARASFLALLSRRAAYGLHFFRANNSRCAPLRLVLLLLLARDYALEPCS